MSPTSSPATAEIAFICAMPMEIEPLIRKLGLDESTVRRRRRCTAGPWPGGPWWPSSPGWEPSWRQPAPRACSTRVQVDQVVVVGITGARGERDSDRHARPSRGRGGLGDGRRVPSRAVGGGHAGGGDVDDRSPDDRPRRDRPPARPRRGVARHGDRGDRGAVRTTGHPVVGVPGHQRPRHRRERRRGGLQALQHGRDARTTRPSSGTSPTTPSASRPWPSWPKGRCSAPRRRQTPPSGPAPRCDPGPPAVLMPAPRRGAPPRCRRGDGSA